MGRVMYSNRKVSWQIGAERTFNHKARLYRLLIGWELRHKMFLGVEKDVLRGVVWLNHRAKLPLQSQRE